MVETKTDHKVTAADRNQPLNFVRSTIDQRINQTA